MKPWQRERSPRKTIDNYITSEVMIILSLLFSPAARQERKTIWRYFSGNGRIDDCDKINIELLKGALSNGCVIRNY